MNGIEKERERVVDLGSVLEGQCGVEIFDSWGTRRTTVDRDRLQDTSTPSGEQMKL